jgi:hypothetical protein
MKNTKTISEKRLKSGTISSQLYTHSKMTIKTKDSRPSAQNQSVKNSKRLLVSNWAGLRIMLGLPKSKTLKIISLTFKKFWILLSTDQKNTTKGTDDFIKITNLQ